MTIIRPQEQHLCTPPYVPAPAVGRLVRYPVNTAWKCDICSQWMVNRVTFIEIQPTKWVRLRWYHRKAHRLVAEYELGKLSEAME